MKGVTDNFKTITITIKTSMKKHILMAAICASLTVFAACSGNSKQGTSDSSDAGPDSAYVNNEAGTATDSAAISGGSKQDTAIVNFVIHATKGGMMEVNSGKLATEKGKSTDVKSFGARMVADHSKANAELKSIVAAKKWNIPPPSPTVVTPDAMLTSSTGSDFDRSYVNMMVKDHKKTVMLFEHAAATSPDPQLKAFAAKTLPVLREHYITIQQIANKLNVAYEK
jgi:putative membrane protein